MEKIKKQRFSTAKIGGRVVPNNLLQNSGNFAGMFPRSNKENLDLKLTNFEILTRAYLR